MARSKDMELLNHTSCWPDHHQYMLLRSLNIGSRGLTGCWGAWWGCGCFSVFLLAVFLQGSWIQFIFLLALAFTLFNATFNPRFHVETTTGQQDQRKEWERRAAENAETWSIGRRQLDTRGERGNDERANWKRTGYLISYLFSVDHRSCLFLPKHGNYAIREFFAIRKSSLSFNIVGMPR